MSALTGTATIAEMQTRDLARRRLAVVMLAALPLAIYLSIPPEEGWELSPGAVGLSWSVGGVALFSALGWRQVDPRLSLAGLSAAPQLLGRAIPLVILGLVLGAVMLPIQLVRSNVLDQPALALAVLTTVVVGAPLGLAIGAVFARELEGMLALIAIGGISMSLPADVSGAWLTPLWGPTRLVLTAWTDDGAGYTGPVLHALLSAALLGAVTWVAWRRPVRVRGTDGRP